MREKQKQIFEDACEIVRKFGFLSRDIVWNCLAEPSRASGYRCWNFLKARPEFAFYKQGEIQSKRHLVASREYRRFLEEGGAVSQRHAIYFKHDETLMEFIFFLKEAKAAREYWTEQELKMDRLATLRLIGDAAIKKPDLVFDVTPDDHPPLRIALEIERTRKSSHRYRLMGMAYRRLAAINLLVIATPDLATEATIKWVFGNSPEPVGFFSLEEFSRLGFGAEFRFQDKKAKLGKFLKSLSGKSWIDPTPRPIKTEEKRENPFRTNSEAA